MFVSRLLPADAAASPYLASRFRTNPVFGEQLSWKAKGVEPRWLGQETSDCAAAFDPSMFHNQGADELRRFLAGTQVRGETALLIVTIGDLTDDSPRSVMQTYDSSVSLPDLRGSISGRRLPTGTRPVLAADVAALADRDLGLRLLNGSAKAWWTLNLSAVTLYPGAGGPPVQHRTQGRLEPILQDALGNPVVAVWLPEDSDERWYIVPDGTDGDLVVDWLVHQALPAFVPNALRRVRSPHFINPDLQTTAEARAAEVLAQMKTRHAQQEAEADGLLQQARKAAEPVRYGLLFGTGKPLENAVAAVLRDAGIAVVNLDEELGTRSADLLASIGDRRALVEVKSATGPPSESLVGDLQRHLGTWPGLKPGVLIDGGVLVVNHHIKIDPSLRPGQVYTRAEFVATLAAVKVVSSRELLDWWRREDWASIQQAILASAAVDGATRLMPPTVVPTDVGKADGAPRRGLWRYRR